MLLKPHATGRVLHSCSMQVRPINKLQACNCKLKLSSAITCVHLLEWQVLRGGTRMCSLSAAGMHVHETHVYTYRTYRTSRPKYDAYDAHAMPLVRLAQWQELTIQNAVTMSMSAVLAMVCRHSYELIQLAVARAIAQLELSWSAQPNRIPQAAAAKAAEDKCARCTTGPARRSRCAGLREMEDL